MAESLFWGSAGAIAATYFIYPAVLWTLTCFRPATPTHTTAYLPGITLVVVAHNESKVIQQRLKNLSHLDYPVDQLRIIVLSDGSTDATPERAQESAPSHAEVIHFPERRGKSGALREILPLISSEIVAFTDANSFYRPDALRSLVAPFTDASVGCVVGQLVYSNTDEPVVGSGEGLYWRYENRIKEWESRLGSTIVANGSIYALRREFIDPGVTHVDFDSLLPLKVLQAGFRVVFEPRAQASEKAAETLGEEFRRKVRIINQQIWGLMEVGGLVSWRTRWPFVALFFHKLLRWSVPFLILINLASIPALPSPFLRQVALSAHGVMVAAGTLGCLLQWLGLPAGPLRTAAYFWAVNLASMVGVLSCLVGHRIVAWEKAPTTR